MSVDKLRLISDADQRMQTDAERTRNFPALMASVGHEDRIERRRTEQGLVMTVFREPPPQRPIRREVKG